MKDECSKMFSFELRRIKMVVLLCGVNQIHSIENLYLKRPRNIQVGFFTCKIYPHHFPVYIIYFSSLSGILSFILFIVCWQSIILRATLQLLAIE